MSSLLTMALAVLLVILAAAVTGVSGKACARRDDSRTGDATTTAAEVTGRTAGVPPPEREILPATPAATGKEPAPPQTGTPAPPAPPSTETLPEWVPESGRLTVIEAGDLARNLGIVDAAAPEAAAPTTAVAPAAADTADTP